MFEYPIKKYGGIIDNDSLKVRGKVKKIIEEKCTIFLIIIKLISVFNFSVIYGDYYKWLEQLLCVIEADWICASCYTQKKHQNTFKPYYECMFAYQNNNIDH